MAVMQLKVAAGEDDVTNNSSDTRVREIVLAAEPDEGKVIVTGKHS